MALAFLDDPHRDFVECLPRVDLRQNFEIIRELGRGRIAKVVLVRRRESGELFAAKMVRLDRTSSNKGNSSPPANGEVGGPSSPVHYRRARDQFQFELTLAYFLSPCPYIIRTQSDAFRTNHHLVALMEPALGGDLASRLSDPHTHIGEHQLKAVAIQLASAIQFIHERSLVHGDIRPENVLLCDATFSIVKLGDFSRTKKSASMVRYGTLMMPQGSPPTSARTAPMSASHSSSSSNEPRSLCLETPFQFNGTDAFTPPEICELSPSDFYTVHSSQDVWGFGMILFCLAVERFPSWQMCSTKSDPVFAEFIDTLNTVVPGHVSASATSCDLHRQASTDGKHSYYNQSLSMLTSSFITLLRGVLETDPSNRAQIKSVRNFTLSRWLTQDSGVRRTSLGSMTVASQKQGTSSNGQSSPALSILHNKIANGVTSSKSNLSSVSRTFSDTALDELSVSGLSQVNDHTRSHTQTTSSPSTSFSASSAEDQVSSSVQLATSIRKSHDVQQSSGLRKFPADKINIAGSLNTM